MKKVKSYNLFLESKDINYSIYYYFNYLASLWNKDTIDEEKIKKLADHFIGDGYYNKIKNHVDKIFNALNKVDEWEIHMRMYDVYDKLSTFKSKYTTCAVVYGKYENWDVPIQNRYNAYYVIKNKKDEANKLHTIINIIKEIIYPTLYKGYTSGHGSTFKNEKLRNNEASEYVTDEHYKCKNFDINYYIENNNIDLASYDILKFKKYDVDRIINLCVPAVIINIGSQDKTQMSIKMNLKKLEEDIDEAMLSILPTIDYEKVVYDMERFSRRYDDDIDIYDYCVKIILKM